MNKLAVEKTEYTPEVLLDINNELIYFKGECRPENVAKFFDPIIDWFKALKNMEVIAKEIPVTFYFDYFNSSSAKYIMDLVFLIDDINKNHKFNLQIVWEYDEEDEDVYEAGVEFEDLSGVKFKFKAV